jgi:hypothetical protein
LFFICPFRCLYNIDEHRAIRDCTPPPPVYHLLRYITWQNNPQFVDYFTSLYQGLSCPSHLSSKALGTRLLILCFYCFYAWFYLSDASVILCFYAYMILCFCFYDSTDSIFLCFYWFYVSMNLCFYWFYVRDFFRIFSWVRFYREDWV